MGEQDSRASKPIHNPIASVSRRFGVGHVMVAVGLFAVMFSALEVFGVGDLREAAWLVYAACALFCTAIPLGQVFLYEGRQPRKASCLVGLRLLPIVVLVGAILLALPAFLAELRMGFVDYQRWGAFILTVAFLVIAASGIGYFAGYAIGTISAGVFLVVDGRWNAGRRVEGASDEAETSNEVTEGEGSAPPTGKWWLDWIAWSPVMWVWQGRHRPWRSVFLVTILVGVLFLVSLLISMQVLPSKYWLIHLSVALIAAPLTGVTLAGLFRAGRRVPVVFCIMGVLTCIFPFYLLTGTWAWAQFTSENQRFAPRHYATFVDSVAATGLVIGITVTGIVIGLIVAGLYGWARIVLDRKGKPAGRWTAVAFGAGLVAIVASLSVAVMGYRNSPRERALQEIMAAGGDAHGPWPLSANYMSRWTHAMPPQTCSRISER